jgi:hypothetical protein
MSRRAGLVLAGALACADPAAAQDAAVAARAREIAVARAGVLVPGGEGRMAEIIAGRPALVDGALASFARTADPRILLRPNLDPALSARLGDDVLARVGLVAMGEGRAFPALRLSPSDADTLAARPFGPDRFGDAPMLEDAARQRLTVRPFMVNPHVAIGPAGVTLLRPIPPGPVPNVLPMPVNARPDPTAHAAVLRASVVIERQSGGAFETWCSGVLLSPTIVLTAGHCLFPNHDPARQAFAPANLRVRGSTGATVAVARFAEVFGGADFQRDAALLRLAAPLPSPGGRYPVATAHPAQGVAWVMIVGAGVSDQGAAGQLRGAIEMVDFSRTRPFRDPTAVGSQIVLRRPDTNDVATHCPGDSGGPVLKLAAGDEGQVVGLLSRQSKASGNDPAACKSTRGFVLDLGGGPPGQDTVLSRLCAKARAGGLDPPC